MKLDKLVALIGGIALFGIFIYGMITNFGSLYEPDLTAMAIIMLGTLLIGLFFISYALEKDGAK